MKNIFTLIFVSAFFHFSADCAPLSFPPTSEFAEIRSNLYIAPANKANVLMDGTLTQYDAGYSNEVDGMDARKMTNMSENFGMLRGNTVLIVERRKTIQNSDTIFFKMWNMRIITYQLEFITSNLNSNGRIGILKDNYLNTSKPLDLNGTTLIDFSVTSDPASKAADRFTVIFTTPSYSLLPLTFNSMNAYAQNHSVAIDWKTTNENNIKQFDIERSADGTYFEKLTTIPAGNKTVNNYQVSDSRPAEGNNYYRIRSVELDGQSKYSEVMKVSLNKTSLARMSVFPNPAVGNNLNLQLTNQPAGVYEMRLLNTYGQPVLSKSIQHSGGNATINLKPSSVIPKGIYQLEIQSPAGERKVISVLF